MMTSSKIPEIMSHAKRSKYGILAIIYLALFLDNMLLTVVVPIIPDFLHSIDMKILPKSAFYDNIENMLTPTASKLPETEETTRLYQHKNISLKTNEIVVIRERYDKTQIKSKNKSSQKIKDGQGEKVSKKYNDKDFVDKIEDEQIESENAPVGFLLSSKALVQLLLNPVVGMWATNIGYKVPIFFGSINLLIASLLFAYGESYLSMLLARSIQGVSSACIGVSGMSLAAEIFRDDDTTRVKSMGVLLGGGALGVLVGYPLGGFLYHFMGKTAPFLMIAALVFVSLMLQMVFMDFSASFETVEPNSSTSWWPILTDEVIIIVTGAIFISTSAMAILEPCLPIWLMTHLKPEKWQVGTVFIPDSLGYLLGTNLFGAVACKVGQWRVSVTALLVIAIAAFMIPSATSLGQLLLPHFGLGLGIGALDAALVPQLASLVDQRHTACYGAVFSLQQTAVSLAYSIAPLVGGALARGLGFSWTLRGLGLLNALYSSLLATLAWKLGSNIQRTRLHDSQSDCEGLNQAISMATYGAVYDEK